MLNGEDNGFLFGTYTYHNVPICSHFFFLLRLDSLLRFYSTAHIDP
jgi:hypothetical protein